MKTIYKYPLDIEDVQVLNLPKGAEIVSVQNQNERLYLWAIVDPVEEKEPRCFYIVGTGGPMPPETKLKLLSHVQFQKGSLIFHVFEEVEK